VPSAAQNTIPTRKNIKQVGRIQRTQLHSAYKFHAPTATGSALRKNFAASFSTFIAGFTFGEALSTLGIAFVRKSSGMVKFVPQYVQAI
jgi:hypothetical protein